MLYPIENRVREVRNPDGIWRFKIDRHNCGMEEKWYAAPLTNAVPMAVPASYNDLVTDVTWKEHVLRERGTARGGVPRKERKA